MYDLILLYFTALDSFPSVDKRTSAGLAMYRVPTAVTARMCPGAVKRTCLSGGGVRCARQARGRGVIAEGEELGTQLYTSPTAVSGLSDYNIKSKGM